MKTTSCLGHVASQYFITVDLGSPFSLRNVNLYLFLRNTTEAHDPVCPRVFLLPLQSNALKAFQHVKHSSEIPGVNICWRRSEDRTLLFVLTDPEGFIPVQNCKQDAVKSVVSSRRDIFRPDEVYMSESLTLHHQSFLDTFFTHSHFTLSTFSAVARAAVVSGRSH